MTLWVRHQVLEKNSILLIFGILIVRVYSALIDIEAKSSPQSLSHNGRRMDQ